MLGTLHAHYNWHAVLYTTHSTLAPSIHDRADQGLSTTAQLIPAGTVFPGTPFNPSAANQCAYGPTYRSSKRGGQYIATVADCPQPSIYVRRVVE